MWEKTFLKVESHEANRGAASQKRARLWKKTAVTPVSKPQCGSSPRSGDIANSVSECRHMSLGLSGRGIPRTPQSAPQQTSAVATDAFSGFDFILKISLCKLAPRWMDGWATVRVLKDGSLEPSTPGGGDRPGEDSAPSQEGDNVIRQVVRRKLTLVLARKTQTLPLGVISASTAGDLLPEDDNAVIHPCSSQFR